LLTASTAGQSTFSWTTGLVIGNITGSGAGSGNTLNQVLVNPGDSAAGSVVYNITATSAAGCVGASPAAITVTVNALPTLKTNGPLTICSGAPALVLH
jgi:hypothetical protein